MEKTWELKEFEKEPPPIALEDVCGREVWKNLFYGCAAEEETAVWLGFPATHCFLLFGREGAGKTFLARAFAAEMAKKGYRFLELHGADLEAPQQEEREARLNQVRQTLCSGERFFLLLHNPEEAQEEAQRRLAGILEEMKQKKVPAVVTALCVHPEQLLSVLRLAFLLCRVCLPDESAREAYFQKSWGNTFLAGKPAFGAAKMAVRTEGMNYAQLELIRQCVSGVMYKQGIALSGTPEEFRQAVEQHRLLLSEKRFCQIAEEVRKSQSERAGNSQAAPDNAYAAADGQGTFPGKPEAAPALGKTPADTPAGAALQQTSGQESLFSLKNDTELPDPDSISW